MLTGSGGLKVAYVSGSESGESSACGLTAADVTRVRDSCVRGQPSYRGVDILITSEWPQDITRLDDKAVSNSGVTEQLCVKIRLTIWLVALCPLLRFRIS